MLNVLVEVFRMLATHPAGKQCSDACTGSPGQCRVRAGMEINTRGHGPNSSQHLGAGRAGFRVVAKPRSRPVCECMQQ